MLTSIAVVREGLSRLAEGDLRWNAPDHHNGEELAQIILATGRASHGVGAVVTRVGERVEVEYLDGSAR